MPKRKQKDPVQTAPEGAETATLWVWQQRSGGQLPCLCLKGRKYMLCVTAGGGGRPVRLIKRPVEEFARCRIVQKAGQPYPAPDSITRLTEIGERNGITAAAAKVLLAAREKAHVSEDEYHDEEELESMTNETPATAGSDETTNSPTEETTVSKTTKTRKTAPATKKAAPKKAAAKKTGKVKAASKKTAAPRAPSKISKAVEWMSAEVKKAGGHDKLERGFRKELLEKAAAKFELAVSTCSIQYNKQVVGK